jgi:hypothetical protein
MGEHTPAGLKRGLGPFSSRQLTVIVCVAIVSFIVIIPTTALAAIGTFTSSTAAPAVTAFNSSPAPNAAAALGRAGGIGNAPRIGVVGAASGAAGTGVRGTGAQYGVFSNGPLGVSGTHPLRCTKCVTANDVANRITFSYNLAPGADSAPVAIPANVPVHLMGTQTTVGVRGVGFVVMLRIPNQFLEWTGLDSTSASAITQGFSATAGTKIVFLDFAHLVAVQVNNANTIRIHNGSAGQRTGSVLITW